MDVAIFKIQKTMKPDRYIPSEEEMQRAESMMTDEQREASRIREKYYEQEQPPWEPYDELHLDKNFKRIPPTPEQTQEMDQRLSELSKLFEGSGLRWHLDGAINISAMRGDYIGYHKDVDISIEKEDLAALESWLLKKGYAFFCPEQKELLKKKLCVVQVPRIHTTPIPPILLSLLSIQTEKSEKIPP